MEKVIDEGNNVKILAILIVKKIEKNAIDETGTNDTHRVIN